MDSIIAKNGARDPALRALLARACAAANFLRAPEHA